MYGSFGTRVGVPIYRDVLLRRASLSTTEPPDCAVFFGGETTTKGGKGQLIGKLQNEDRRSDKVMDKEGNAGNTGGKGSSNTATATRMQNGVNLYRRMWNPSIKVTWGIEVLHPSDIGT